MNILSKLLVLIFFFSNSFAQKVVETFDDARPVFEGRSGPFELRLLRLLNHFRQIFLLGWGDLVKGDAVFGANNVHGKLPSLARGPSVKEPLGRYA